MEVTYSAEFLKAVDSLPVQARKKLDSLLILVAKNYLHPLLHTKRLMGKFANTYSFRITRDYRVLFVLESKPVIKLTIVGHRKDIYR